MNKIKEEDKIIESSLLKVMSLRENFEAYYELLDKGRLLPNTKLLLDDYNTYFTKYDHNEIEWGTFTTEFTQQWHKKDLDDADIIYYRDTLIPMIQSKSDNDARQVLVSLLDREFSIKINDLLSKDIDLDLVSNAVNTYIQYKSQYVEDTDDAYTIDQVVENPAAEGVPWCLPNLQRNNGDIKLGDFIIVFAYNEVGKGAFAVHQAAKTIAAKPDGPVLYFTSEDAVRKLYGRVLSCLYNKHVPEGFHKIMENFKDMSTDFISKFGKDCLKVYELDFGDMSKIQAAVDKWKPSLLIIDMADTLCPETEDPMTLKRVYDTLRQIANRKCPVMATSQANETSYWDEAAKQMNNKKWLDRKDCYGSKVGKPSAATIMIGIAEDYDMPTTKYIHTPKNKEREKIKITCELVEQYSLYKEL